MHRRELLSAAGGGICLGLGGCLGRFDTDGATGTSIRTVEVESSISVAVFRWGLREGVWADRGIDLDFETAPFGRYNRQIVDGEANVGAPSAVAQLELTNKGEPLTFVAPQQNMFNRMFARADDGTIEDPTDLTDRRLGLPASLSSTTSIVHRVLVEDEYEFDIVEDTADTRAAEPPALWEFLLEGELDAVSQFSGFTIRGMADDGVKTIFDPYALWYDRTGVGVPTTAFTVRPEWLSEHADAVDDFLAGWAAALDSFGANTEAALEEFGADAGITDPDEAAVVVDLMDDGVVFGPAYYDEELVDAHWTFFELLADADEIGLGDRETTFRTQEELRG
ncbi:ABC transporter substrate-binding protein [Natronomonas sp.]|uniref:ABC transporter substrate-binding protein n=1 Tax=Natronomonas sp. TaxID=2184060 RepID=UPI0039771645